MENGAGLRRRRFAAAGLSGDGGRAAVGVGAVRQRLGEVQAAHGVLAVEVGKGAGDP